MIARWIGTGLAVAVVLLAGTQLSCLAGDLADRGRGEAAVEPLVPVEVPVRFEVDHAAPGPRPVLTR